MFFGEHGAETNFFALCDSLDIDKVLADNHEGCDTDNQRRDDIMVYHSGINGKGNTCSQGCDCNVVKNQCYKDDDKYHPKEESPVKSQ